jgi:hypothetical protein
MTMTPRKELRPATLGKASHALAILTTLAVLTVGMDRPRVLAEPVVPSPAPAAKVDGQATKPQRPAAKAGKASKSTVTKNKPHAASKPGKPTPASTAKATPAPPMDFDNDEVEGQRLAPGFELIEGAPQRARQPSLVPLSPSPQDSVVNRN